MKIATTYHALRRVGYMIALDVGTEIVGIFLPVFLSFAAELLEGLGAPEAAAVSLDGVRIYLIWTSGALKMLAWSVILASLSWVNDAHRDFDRARVCYLLQILVYLIASVLNAVFDRVSFERGGPSMVSLLTSPPRDPASGGFSLYAAAPALYYGTVSILYFLETLLIPLGNRLIFNASAAVMDAMGQDAAAAFLRRGGKRLFRSCLIFSASLYCLLGMGVAEARREAAADAASPALFYLALSLLMIVVGSGLTYTVRWFLASGKLLRVCRKLKELTE